jgi:hypothetical protein
VKSKQGRKLESHSQGVTNEQNLTIDHLFAASYRIKQLLHMNFRQTPFKLRSNII